MNRVKLILTANKIDEISRNALDEYVAKGDILVNQVNTIMLNRLDILELIGGEKNIGMMRDNHSNHFRFISSIIEMPDGETLVDTVSWVFRAYMSRGFSSNYWAAQINTWIMVLKENLSEKSYVEIVKMYNWLSINIPYFSMMSEEKIAKL